MTKTVDRDIQAAKRAARQRRSSGRVAAGFLGALASGLVAMPALAQSIIVQGNTRTDADVEKFRVNTELRQQRNELRIQLLGGFRGDGRAG